MCRLASPVDAGPLRLRAGEASSPQARASPFSSLLRTAVLNSGQFCTPGDPGRCLERFRRQNSGGGAPGIQWIESGMLPTSYLNRTAATPEPSAPCPQIGAEKPCFRVICQTSSCSLLVDCEISLLTKQRTGETRVCLVLCVLASMKVHHTRVCFCI